MTQLLNLCIFLSFTAKLAKADISLSLRVLTFSDRTDVTCCHKNKTLSHCFFYADSRNINKQNSSGRCCELSVSTEELLKAKASKTLPTTIILQCSSKPDGEMSPNVTVTVWRLSLFGKYIFAFLIILGTVILLTLLIFIITYVICLSKKQGCRERIPSARAQGIDTDNQHGNSGSAEVQEEATDIIQEELLYSTVNYSGANANSVPAVDFDSGTVYATVVIN